MIIRSRAVPRGNPSDGREASMCGGEKSWVFSIFNYGGGGGDIINGWDCKLMILFSHVLEREREEKRRRESLWVWWEQGTGKQEEIGSDYL